MNVHQMFPSRYVTAFDLNGSDVTAKILRVGIEEMRSQRGTENKPVVYFENAKKAMVLNKTNAMTIASLYGPETDDWAGKMITLYATDVDAFGKTQRAIRIRPQAPADNNADKQIEEVVTDPPPDDGPDLDEYEYDEADEIPY